MKFLKIVLLCMGIICITCACENKSKNTPIKEENTDKVNKMDRQDEIQDMDSKERFTFSNWMVDETGMDEMTRIDLHYMQIEDSEKNNSIILYDTGEKYDCTVLENGVGRINKTVPRSSRLPNDDYKIVGKYELSNENVKDIVVSEFSFEKEDFGETSSYSIDATLSSSNQEQIFLVAYKIYSEITDYSCSRVGLMQDGTMQISDYVTRTNNVDEKFDVKVLGCVDFDTFDNTKIFYHTTDFEITYDVRGQLEEKKSYRRFWGTTPVSLDDNTMVGILKVKVNSDSELGIKEGYQFVNIANGEGNIETFLEIPGEQAEDPKYQFIVDGIIPFELIE